MLAKEVRCLVDAGVFATLLGLAFLGLVLLGGLACLVSHVANDLAGLVCALVDSLASLLRAFGSDMLGLGPGNARLGGCPACLLEAGFFVLDDDDAITIAELPSSMRFAEFDDMSMCSIVKSSPL